MPRSSNLTYFGFVLCALLGVSGCCARGASNTATAPTTANSATVAPTHPAYVTPTSTALAATIAGLSTPEGMLYDPATDLYLVSNVNGTPIGKDDNGFIARFQADGSTAHAKWIDGASATIELNAPKGMVLVGDELWVTDIDCVRVFDRETGASKKAVCIRGATFLNDVALAANGSVYVTDSGFTLTDKGFEQTGADAVYAFAPGNFEPQKIQSGASLGRPNGILAVGDKVYVVTFGTGELHTLTNNGATLASSEKLAKGSLDGIVGLPNGDLLISSWDGSNVYVGRPGKGFSEIATGIESPADIAYDSKRDRLLVPLFMKNEARVFELKR